MTTEWHDVGASADVSEDMPLTTKLGDKEIGVYRLKGQYYALEDVCPHAYALLSQGFVMNDEIECPLHGARWNICSGKMTADQATKAKEREELGESVTRWLRSNGDLEVVDRVVSQSSDNEFHCLTITLFYVQK